MIMRMDGGPMSTFATIVRVRVPERSYRNELRAIKIVWTRELIRFRKDRLGSSRHSSSRCCSCSRSAPG